MAWTTSCRSCGKPRARWSSRKKRCRLRISDGCRSVPGYCRRLFFAPEEGHRLDPVAFRIADKGSVIALAIFRSEARGAVGTSTGLQRRPIERVDRRRFGSAQRNVQAAIGIWDRHLRAMVEPEFRIALSEPDGAGLLLQFRIAEHVQNLLVKARHPREIANAEGDMVDHPGGPASCRGAGLDQLEH